MALLLAAAPGHVLGQQKIRVVATSADLKSLAEAVGGARVEVESLAAPEHDPHAIEVKPAQLSRVREAALVVRVGLDHEPWFAKLKLPGNIPVLDASRNVRLTQTQTPRLRAERRAHVHAFGNTHDWLDPANAVQITDAIRTSLSSLSARDAPAFARNREAFLVTLKHKVEAWQAALAPFRGAKLVVMHDSWTYFAESFGLDIVGAAEPHPGVPPSPAELAALFERMREARVRVLVTDPSSNAALARQIAEKTGARIVLLHPSGHDYVGLFDRNVSALAQALRASSR